MEAILCHWLGNESISFQEIVKFQRDLCSRFCIIFAVLVLVQGEVLLHCIVLTQFLFSLLSRCSHLGYYKQLEASEFQKRSSEKTSINNELSRDSDLGGVEGNKSQRAFKEYLPSSMVASVSRGNMMVSGNAEKNNSDLWKKNEEGRIRLNGRKHFFTVRLIWLRCCQETVAVPFKTGQREQSL